MRKKLTIGRKAFPHQQSLTQPEARGDARNHGQCETAGYAEHGSDEIGEQPAAYSLVTKCSKNGKGRRKCALMKNPAPPDHCPQEKRRHATTANGKASDWMVPLFSSTIALAHRISSQLARVLVN